MPTKKLKYIFDQFNHHGVFVDYDELASGHINDTFLIKTKQKPFFILQRINHGVFRNVKGLIENKVAVSEHIQEKSTEYNTPVLTFLRTKEGRYYLEAYGGFWNLSYFIDNCVTHEVVKSANIAHEGGRLVGKFLRLTSDFDVSNLVETIPRFHDMSFRFSQFENALKVASKERLDQAELQIEAVNNLKTEMHVLLKLKNSGKIRTRVTHNDTKISNILFSKQGKGLCVIDTDTVMPGIVHYDFGDSIRSICNTTSEDDPNLSNVEFNLDYYEAYYKGFISEIGTELSALEKEYLPLGAKTMIFIMALRFLTDFLNEDYYYKTKYAHHNLDRSKNQLKLIESFEKKKVSSLKFV